MIGGGCTDAGSADTVKWVDDQGGAGFATHRHCEFTELPKHSTHSCLINAGNLRVAAKADELSDMKAALSAAMGSIHALQERVRVLEKEKTRRAP